MLGGRNGKKRPNYVYQKNAKRGAITRQCPGCGRKIALGQVLLRIWYDENGKAHAEAWRFCRYHGYKASA